MKNFVISLVAVFAICVQALAAAPTQSPVLPDDLETAWKKQPGPSCTPSPEKTISVVIHLRQLSDNVVHYIVITMLNGERVSISNIFMFMGTIPVEVNTYVRDRSGWKYYDFQSQESADQMSAHENAELGITSEQYAKCFGL